MPDIRVCTINEAVKKTKEDLVFQAEADYKEHLLSLAEKVINEKIHAVLLAGPSAAGKTTSANLLADAIRDRGHRAEVISLDNFYRDASDPDYPRFENGDRNMECAEALQLPKIRKVLAKIDKREGFSVPIYDFKLGKSQKEEWFEPITDGCVILEGLHALNPLISADLPTDARVLKVFVSVSTNLLNDDGETILSGKKMRFLRRLVRDNLYRAASGERTLTLWKQVLAGEGLYLYPFKPLADVRINTFHAFEVSVLRPLAEPLLKSIQDDPYAAYILSGIRNVEPMEISLVPDDSLIREFIPGGKYEDKY